MHVSSLIVHCFSTISFQAFKATSKAHVLPSTSFSSSRTKRLLEDDAEHQSEPMDGDVMEIQTTDGGTSESVTNTEESKRCKTDESKRMYLDYNVKKFDNFRFDGVF